MITNSPTAAEVSDIDVTARRPLLYLFGSAFLWLVLSGLFAVVNSLQLTMPALLAHCPVLTYGRLHAAHESAFIYGWAANAGMAISLWLLSRLGLTMMRGASFVCLGGLFWNIGVLVGVGGILIGDATTFSGLQMPLYAHAVLLVAFGFMAVAGVLAWSGRKHETAFASQWYALAAIFLFPWIFSIALISLLLAPGAGTSQSVVSAWFAENLYMLWLAPMALGALYYLLPKITAKAIPHYSFAGLGFWTLIVVGSWTGPRVLVNGPVPAWIPTVAIALTFVALMHYWLVWLNLRGLFATRGSIVLKFAALGFAAYILTGLANAVLSFRTLANVVQFTYVTDATGALALIGSISLTFFAAIYFIVPRLCGRAWPSAGLVRIHFGASVLGVVAIVVGLAVAGWVQGRELNSTADFAHIAAVTKPWLLLATAGQALLLVGNILATFHFLRLIACRRNEVTLPAFRAPAAMEVSVS
ncbi:cbb3-type cytochrome c oxidase subunit I [Horticoccus luteus]|uniref:Cbb3-type cytochrome c oxidase subunit I n=1 Tax=Horticoccus luteus TaxID=2862869 RepID=A0A8F9TXY8_9BACT|nr:cbb3-type cytochrome c oxidase subunit I [Horticoccus luteus]QYM79803.1 cbb3-type cytochrome c oxidase subunit I [Horticoccus luteus]